MVKEFFQIGINSNKELLQQDFNLYLLNFCTGKHSVNCI